MIRKIFGLIPRIIQERIKLFYYNRKVKDYSFSLEAEGYRTISCNWSVLTKNPLYFVVKDIERYERYYKVSKGNVVLDAGANEGIFSVIYSKKVGPEGLVLSFEPDEINQVSFKETIALNGDPGNVVLCEKGLWNSLESESTFFETGTVGSSVFKVQRKAVEKKIKVISIDAVAERRHLQKLDFIKMDIEGAEIEAILGAKKVLKKFKPNLAIASYHLVDNDYTYKKLEQFFSALDYPFRTVHYDDGEIITYAGSGILE